LAGIYIHIPFCKKACFYCDFHFDISLKHKDAVLSSLQKEIVSNANFFNRDDVMDSIYFGGGTPSVLSKNELSSILNALYNQYTIATNAEITFECNPDDLSLSYLADLKSLGVNRLSIGVQSFKDDHLKWMNRSHDSAQSFKCIDMAASVGFTDITLDLIYGIPGLGLQEWQETVERALELPINHLSAYGLTLEPNTPYQRLVDQKKYQSPKDENTSTHFETLVAIIHSKGWEHYEVSNFCKTGNYSRHNTAYWQNKKYLGLGPSAHSFTGTERRWNVSNNAEYISKIAAGEHVFESEFLSVEDRVNEYLLTGLRTKWGVNLAELNSNYGHPVHTLFSTELGDWEKRGWITISQGQLTLTSSGLLFADYIASELFKLKDKI